MHEVVRDVARRMTKAIDVFRDELKTLRTGRASLGILDPVRIEYYGVPTPLSQVANLSVPEATLIVIQPWDPTLIGTIEHAIQKANLGLNPMNDGKIIRVPIPQLTEERRKELVKRLHHMAEDHRVTLRNIRRDANEHLKKALKDKAISEDDERRALEETQKLTDTHIARLDQLAKGKEKEILEIR